MMLHWLAGQRAPDGQNDPDATNVEAPETPAPVFAVRAFKHALFGTPQTTQQQQPRPAPRRNSNTDNARPRGSNNDPRPARPGMAARPKSASDAQTLAAQPYIEALGSPTKSILVREGMGTPGGKKKNVTFGELVLDNEDKRPLKGGLPDDVPGKFPSLSEEDDYGVVEEKIVAKAEKARGRNKLTEALEQARDESRRRKKSRKEVEEAESEVPVEFREPKSEAGTYWKREYDVYRANTQREVKKLITKQKAAKSYALSKDLQCTELADQLSQEQRKVEELGTKTAELSAQMREMEEKLRAGLEAEKRQADEIAMLKRQLGRRDSARPSSRDGLVAFETATRDLGQREHHKLEPAKRGSREAPKPEADPVQRPSEPYRYSPEAEKPKLDIQTLRARLKAKQEPPNPKSAEDIWAQSFNSPSPFATRTGEKPPPSPKAARVVTSGTDATPLKTLDINSLPPPKEPRRNSSLGSMEVECKSTPDLDRADSNASGQRRRDSSLQSPSFALRSASDLLSATSTAVKQEPVPRPRADELPPSSPHPKPLPSRPAPASSGPRDAAASAVKHTANTKENIAPSKPLPPTPTPTPTPSEPVAKQAEKLTERPSVLWSSIGAAQTAANMSAALHASQASQTSKRNASLTTKDGREVGIDRLEAAKKRLEARKVSRLEGS